MSKSVDDIYWEVMETLQKDLDNHYQQMKKSKWTLKDWSVDTVAPIEKDMIINNGTGELAKVIPFPMDRIKRSKK